MTGLENTTTFGVALPKRPAVPDPKHTDKAMFSCGSLAPKLKGGCMDHGFSRCGSLRPCLFVLSCLRRGHAWSSDRCWLLVACQRCCTGTADTPCSSNFR